MKRVNQLPTLKAVLNLEGEHGNGLCFHRSAALCADLPGSHLVIGIFKPNKEAVREAGGQASKEPFFHCWVESCGHVLAPTTIEHFGDLEPMHKLGYYNINGAHKIRRITRDRLFQIFKRNPEIVLQLQFGIQPKKDGLLVDKLMKAARLNYRLTPTNGVVPA